MRVCLVFCVSSFYGVFTRVFSKLSFLVFFFFGDFRVFSVFFVFSSRFLFFIFPPIFHCEILISSCIFLFLLYFVFVLLFLVVFFAVLGWFLGRSYLVFIIKG